MFGGQAGQAVPRGRLVAVIGLKLHQRRQRVQIVRVGRQHPSQRLFGLPVDALVARQNAACRSRTAIAPDPPGVAAGCGAG